MYIEIAPIATPNQRFFCAKAGAKEENVRRMEFSHCNIPATDVGKPEPGVSPKQ